MNADWRTLRNRGGLPQVGVDVLVYSPGDAHGDYQVAGMECHDGEVWWLDADGREVFNVEAWRPLPLYPRG